MIETWLNKTPIIHPSAYVHPTAVIVGDVIVGAECSIWAYAVIRGDMGRIVIGDGTNVQEHVLIHSNHGIDVHVGKRVTIGHRVILHGATVDDDVLLGMGSILLDESHVHTDSIVGANALITSNKQFEAGSLLMGSPAKLVREVNEKERQGIKQNAMDYIQLARQRKEQDD